MPPTPSPLPPSVAAIVDELRHAGLSEAWVKDTLAFSTVVEQWPPSSLPADELATGKAYLLDLAETLSYRHRLILDAVQRLDNAGLQSLAVAKGVADVPAYRTLLRTAEMDGGLAPYFVRRTGPVSPGLESGETIFHRNLVAMVENVTESTADACAMCLSSLPVDLLTPGIGSLALLIHVGCAAATCAASS